MNGKKKRTKRNWVVPKGQEPTDLDRRVMALEEQGCLVPSRRLILNDEQIAGIRRSGVVNTGILDIRRVREDMGDGIHIIEDVLLGDCYGSLFHQYDGLNLLFTRLRITARSEGSLPMCRSAISGRETWR